MPAAAFVLVWSSGYISGPAAVHAAAPFTVLGWRFSLAAVLGAGLALVLRRPVRMDRAVLGRVAAVGFVMNAVQFGLMYVAFDLGLGPTLASLFHALSPVLTALLAAALLGQLPELAGPPAVRPSAAPLAAVARLRLASRPPGVEGAAVEA